MAANEEIGFKISVDPVEAKAQVKELRASFAAAEEDLKGIEDAFGKTSEQAKEAREYFEKLAKQIEQIDGKPIKSLRQEIKEAQTNAVEMVRQFGQFSPEAVEAAAKLGTLKDEMGDLTELSKGLTEENRFAAFANFGGSLAAGFTAAQGAIGLVSDNTKDLEKVIAKVNSAMAFSQGLAGVAKLGENFKFAASALQSFTLVQKANSAATVAAAAIQKLFTGSVETTSTSFKVLRGAIIGTGIGALVVAVGYVINNFDKLKETIFKFLPFLETVSKFIGKIVDAVTDFVGITSEAGRQADALKDSIEGQNTIYDRQIQLLEASGAKSKVVSKLKQQQLDAEIESLKKVGELNGKNTDEEIKRLSELQFNKKLVQATQDKQDADDAKAAAAKAKEKAEKATEAAIEELKARHVGEVNVLKAQGKDITDLRKKQIDDEIKLLKASGPKYRTAIVALEAEKQTVTAEGAKALLEGRKKDSDRLIALLKDEHKTEIELAKARGEETLKLRQQQIEDEIYSLKHSGQDYAQAVADLEAEKAGINAQIRQQQADAEAKAAEDKQKKDEELQAKIKAKKDVAAEYDQNAALQQITDKYDAQRQLVGDNEELLTAIAAREAQERQEVKAKFAELEIDNEQKKLSTIGGLLQSASALFGKQTLVGKGIAIAEATISTYLGATKALASTAGAGPFGVAAGIAQAALVVGAGFKNIREIIKTKVPGVSDGGGGSASPSLAATPPAVSTAPTISGIQSTLVDNTDQMAANRDALKAYVVESEITQKQERSKAITQTATF